MSALSTQERLERLERCFLLLVVTMTQLGTLEEQDAVSALMAAADLSAINKDLK